MTASIKKYDSAMRPELREWVKKTGEVDILVGIPSFNSEDTVGPVIETAALGLAEHFPERRSAILISDGGSLDDSREQAEGVAVQSYIERHVTIYRGIPGKGTSLRAIFETATQLRASVCMVLDSDLRSMTPGWVKRLAEPVLSRQADFIAPYYLRHKYDGTITNNLVYPLTRALYDRQIRQPIGGDFGFSGEMAAFFAGSDVWETDIARFGIDIWMTTSALCEGFKIAQARLGVKLHNPKDPAEDLGAMFIQVVGTAFSLMDRYKSRWIRVEKSTPTEILGEPEGMPKLEPVSVSLNRLKEEFKEGLGHFSGFYREVLDPENFGRLLEVADALEEKDELVFPPDLWARILYDFAHTFQLWDRNRTRLVSMLVPIYFGRTADYCRQVASLNTQEAETVVEAQAQIFEREKGYLRNKFAPQPEQA